jgi:putative transposase
MRLKELAALRPRFGYRRLHVLLCREGWQINHKVTDRLYCEEGLQVRTRRRRKIAAQPRLRLDVATRVDERWSMDFVTDQLANGRCFRVLTVIDQFSRECVALHAGLSIRSQHLGKVLDKAIRPRNVPAVITCDNGSEFTFRYFDACVYSRKIGLGFIRPGKPVENAFFESFNGRHRDECLSQNWFVDLNDVQASLAASREDYNVSRPRTSLGSLAPVEYVAKMLAPAELKEVV